MSGAWELGQRELGLYWDEFPSKYWLFVRPFVRHWFTMKFYVHFDGPPVFTMVFKWNSSETGTLKNLLEIFLAAFNAKYSPLTELSLDNTSLVDMKKTVLLLEKEVKSVVKHSTDLFVVARELPEPKERQRKVLGTLVKSSVSPIRLLSEKEKSGKLANEVTATATCGTASSDKELHCSRGETTARFTLSNLKKVGSLRNAARICAKALEGEENNTSALSCLAEIYLEAARPSLALKYIEAAIQVNPDDPGLNFTLGNCLAHVGRLQEATNAYLKYMSHLEVTGASKRQIHDVQAAIAKIFAKEGKIQMARELFANVLKEDDTHLESLKGYAIHTAGFSQKDLHEAIAVMTSALVHSTGNREIRKEVAKLISWPGGMGVFKDQLSETWESSESMMYMADILRESGAIKQALELVKHACELSPQDPSICLYLVHTYEILNEHNKAFLEASAFLKKNHALKIGNLSISQIVPFLQQVTEDIYLNNAPVTVLPCFSNQENTGRALDSEFQQLGLLFTLVKILFVRGALNLVNPLLPILDKLHNDRGLHLTLLRNEAAFYSCISYVMKVPFSPLPQNPKFVYFAADSHCISPAWRVINYIDEPHVIHPLLATGVKLWHIRKEGCFYPKFSLLNALKAVPNGSVVIFNIGEIDCREGLLRAVNNCKYDTMEEAIAAAVDIYIGFLLEQKEQRSFVTFVHPVFPILDETRSVVLQFNEKLEKHVKDCSGLHWLDLMDELLVNGNSEFNHAYKLDGTHVHPKYMFLLEKALKGSVC